MSLRCTRHLHRLPGGIHRYGNFILDGHSEKRGTLDSEVGAGRGNGSGNSDFGALRDSLERDMGVMCGLAGELYLEIGVYGGRGGLRGREAGADNHHRKLGPARGLQHMKITVAVSRIE